MGLALAETSSNSMAQRIACATMSFWQGWCEKVVELLPLLALEGEVIIIKRSSWNVPESRCCWWVASCWSWPVGWLLFMIRIRGYRRSGWMIHTAMVWTNWDCVPDVWHK